MSGGGVGQGGVADAVPHAADAHAAAHGAAARVKGGRVRERRLPMRIEGVQALGQPAARLQALAGAGGVAGAQRVAAADLQPVEPELLRQVVHERLVGDGGLGHAEAAEGAGHGLVGEEGPAPGAGVGHAVGAHGVHRHAIGHCGAPAGVGAGVEQRVELHGLQPALGVGAEAGVDARRVALGGGHHGLGAGVDAGHRPPEPPCRQRHQRLHGEVELAAEAAAAGRGHDAHLLGPQPQHQRHLVAVHERRLGGDVDLHAIAGAPRPSRLGLDVGMLHEAGLEAALGHGGAVPQGSGCIAAAHLALHEEIARLRCLNQRSAGGHGGVDAHHRRLHRPVDGQGVVAQRLHRGARSHQRQHCLAAVAHLARGQHRLVFHVRVDAVAIGRHVGGGKDGLDARVGAAHGVQITQGEGGAGVGRAHHPQPQGVGGNAIGAEAVGPRDLGHAVGLEGARAQGAARGWRGGQGCVGGGVHHRLHDLAVTGAAAQHAAQAVLHLGFGGVGVARQQIGRRQDHAWRADAALGAQVPVEGGLDGRQPPVAAQALDGGDGAAARLGHGREAGAHLPAVQQHRAGAAVASVAADLGAREAQLVAQQVRQPRGGRRAHGHRRAVHREGDGFGGWARVVHGKAASAPRVESSRRSSVPAASSR